MVVPDLDVFGPEWALLAFVAWVFWEIYSPKILGTKTAMSPLLDLPSRIDDVEDHTTHLQQKIEDMDKKQVHHIQVSRANARALDNDRNVTINSENVDEYLVDNGIPVALLTRRESDEKTSEEDLTEYSDE